MGYSILVVDDSALTRAAIKRIIRMIDIDVEQILEAADGAQALRVLDTQNVHLVLADLNMPQMDGVEFFHRMKQIQEHAQIPVIVVSTESSVTRVRELLAEGVRGFLHKPFTPEEFRQIITKNLEV